MSVRKIRVQLSYDTFIPVPSGARALWSRIQQNAASGPQPKPLRPEFRVVGSSWLYPRPTENAGLHHSFLADDIAIECMARLALQRIDPRSLNA
jgi:hypothetical protein